MAQMLFEDTPLGNTEPKRKEKMKEAQREKEALDDIQNECNLS